MGEILLFIWLLSSCLCALIDVCHFVKRNIENIPFGLFLIFCPILNVIYSTYILVRYFEWDLKKFL